MHRHTNVKLDKYVLIKSMFWTATLQSDVLQNVNTSNEKMSGY
jgi:hypothetical protein